MKAKLIKLVGASTLVTAACSIFEWRSPIMTATSRASVEAPVPADRARVVFVQEAGGEYSSKGLVRIVDEHGDILGDSLPTTWFSADISPGAHEFFGWETMRESLGLADCGCFLHQCYYVAAMRANLLGGRTYYVRVRIQERSSGEIAANEYLDFQRLSSQRASEEPSLIGHLRRMATNSAVAKSLSDAHGQAYATSLLCVGRTRMQEALYWDATTSTLLTDDGMVASTSP